MSSRNELEVDLEAQENSPSTAVDEARSGSGRREPAPSRSERQPALRLRHLVKSFKRTDGSTIRPIDDVSLDLAEGEFLVLLGPSGCGKTTLLRSIAGLESPDSGQVEIAGKDVFRKVRGLRDVSLGPEKRQLGMIFQSYALWPHLTVFKNVAYPLVAAKVPKNERVARVEKALELTGVSEISGQLPGQLSGGQQQRVALARALVSESKLILFDEPLSNVDAKVREDLRVYLKEMQHRIGFTAVYVTHDQDEAMEMADRIAVLDNGRISQIGTPSQIYDHPESRYVARFIGTANEVRGTIITAEPASATVEMDGLDAVWRLALPDRTEELDSGDKVSVIWRPEDAALKGLETTEPQFDPNIVEIPCTFVRGRYLGHRHEAVVSMADQTQVRVATDQLLEHPVGTPLRLLVPTESIHVYPEVAR